MTDRGARPPTRIALAVGSDLLFGSRLMAAAARTGLLVEQATGVDAAAERVASGQVGLVILDLNSPKLDPAGAIARLRSARADVPILACGPHVQEGRLAAAREAGATEVLSRGALDARIDDILRHYLAPAPE